MKGWKNVLVKHGAFLHTWTVPCSCNTGKVGKRPFTGRRKIAREEREKES